MSSKNVEYYQQRALVERGRAKCAPTAEIAAIHEQLAAKYANFIESLEFEEETSDVVDLLLPQEPPLVRSDTGS